jgi:hypothetical protein
LTDPSREVGTKAFERGEEKLQAEYLYDNLAWPRNLTLPVPGGDECRGKILLIEGRVALDALLAGLQAEEAAWLAESLF